MAHKLLLSALLIALTPTPVQAQWKWLKGILGEDQPTQEETASGLKEALRIGTENAVNQTGRLDGYLKNEAIKILLPEPVRKIERGLRFAGFGDLIDEFVVTMNRAAEKAAPEAKAIFWQAVQEMTFQDVYQILRGGDTAATDYFREQTGGSLQRAFMPIVQESMAEAGVTRSYKSIQERVRVIPLLNLESFDLDEYVVEQALNGLFHVLGEEEKKIRTNPAARVTDLLKKVFGAGDSE